MPNGRRGTKDVVKVGPINVQAKEKESVTIPRAAALGAAAIGAVLLVIGRKKGAPNVIWIRSTTSGSAPATRSVVRHARR